jgi:hypothetical protein
VEERLEVLTELLSFQGHRLRAGPEEHDCCSEVLGGPFGDRSPVNIIDDAVVYFLCALTRGRCRSLRAECVVLPCLLFLESLLSLVELVEASTLPFAVTLIMRRFLTSGGIGRSGLIFRGALVRVGGVDHVACCWRTKHSCLRLWGVSAFLQGGALSTSSQLA